MKRLVWLLIVAVGTALAQVQPAAAVAEKPACDCCRDEPAACGMPDCASLPAPATTNALLQVATTREAGAAAHRRLPRSLPAFLVRNESLRASQDFAPGASRPANFLRAPLFRVHCSYLI